MIIMALLNSNNKKKHPELVAWVQKDAGAVDLTPWKYRGIATVAILLFVAVVYLAFSPRRCRLRGRYFQSVLMFDVGIELEIIKLALPLSTNL